MPDTMGVFEREKEARNAIRSTLEQRMGFSPDGASAKRGGNFNLDNGLLGRASRGSSGNFILIDLGM